MDEQTDLFGIPVPSTDRVFLTTAIIHIAFSLVAIVSGLLAMLADKTSPRHYRKWKDLLLVDFIHFRPNTDFVFQAIAT